MKDSCVQKTDSVPVQRAKSDSNFVAYEFRNQHCSVRKTKKSEMSFAVCELKKESNELQMSACGLNYKKQAL